jgi:predicted 3-demethylubiquinone-9 3-methyltransferase (glyoxalase superfamily)
MGNITPFLWFDREAEEAMDLYCSIFGDAKVHSVSRYPEGAPFPAGTVVTAHFEVAGQEFIALNGGPGHPFSDAVSFWVRAETQEEIDRLWQLLTADGGEPGPCGWLKDRFGLSWQIVPSVLMELLGDPDPAKAGRTMQAMLGMSKLDIAALHAAHDGLDVPT